MNLRLMMSQIHIGKLVVVAAVSMATRAIDKPKRRRTPEIPHEPATLRVMRTRALVKPNHPNGMAY